MRKYIGLLLVVSALPLAFSGQALTGGKHGEWDLSIDPVKRVGRVTRYSTERDLIQIYGRENVRRKKISVGEGFEEDGTELFGGTVNAFTIEWKKDFRDPQRFTIENPRSQWIIKNGIKVGTTLEELEKINGRAFKLTGFEWDYPGRTVSWEGGKLPQQLQLDLKSTHDVSQDEYIKVMGDGFFSSTHAVIRKMKLVVERIYIRWDI